MYLNIFAEMARKQIDKQGMAKLMSITPELLEAKLNKKSKLTIKDIFKMQKIFNTKYCTFEYLLNEKKY